MDAIKQIDEALNTATAAEVAGLFVKALDPIARVCVKEDLGGAGAAFDQLLDKTRRTAAAARGQEYAEELIKAIRAGL